jgi:Co/Zn/Cd efflux system component
LGEAREIRVDKKFLQNLVGKILHITSTTFNAKDTSATSFVSSPNWLIHLAINLSFVANIVLFLIKVFLAFYSGSIAIFASAFESFLDILSNTIIFVTIRVTRQKNLYDYPVGKVLIDSIYQF